MKYLSWVVLAAAGVAAYSAWSEFRVDILQWLGLERKKWDFWLRTFVEEGNQPHFYFVGEGVVFNFEAEPIGMKTRKILRDNFNFELIGSVWSYTLRDAATIQ